MGFRLCTTGLAAAIAILAALQARAFRPVASPPVRRGAILGSCKGVMEGMQAPDGFKRTGPLVVGGRVYKMAVLYDPECPLYVREVEMLRKRDLANEVLFADLTSADFNPAAFDGVFFEGGTRALHAVLPDGTVARGGGALRRVHEALGLGWLEKAARLPMVGLYVDKGFDALALLRARLTGGEQEQARVREAQLTAELFRKIKFCDERCKLNKDQQRA